MQPVIYTNINISSRTMLSPEHLTNLKRQYTYEWQHNKYRISVSNCTPQVSPTEMSGGISECNVNN